LLLTSNNQMEKNVSLTSKLENLREIEKIVDEISAEHNIGTEVYGNILIACLEAVNNAISHGNKLDPAKKVEIKFIIEENKLVVITKDQGEGFDYDNVPDPTAPENIENIDGRGIFLMRQLSDGLQFHEEGRISEMIFHL
jgi:serine/threonine-protein kinase RsbW